MFVAAIAHYYSFSHKPFIVTDAGVTPPNCCEAFMSMWDVSDMRDDVLEHAKIIGKCEVMAVRAYCELLGEMEKFQLKNQR